MRPQRLRSPSSASRVEQLGRIPAGDAGQAERRERRLQRLRLARKLVAELHALEAGLAWPPRGRSRAASRRRARACRRSTSRWDWRRCGSSWFSSCCFNRRLRRSRVWISRPLSSARSRSAPRALTASRVGHFRHGDVPPVRRRHRSRSSGSVSMTMTLVRSCRARVAQRRLQLGDRVDLLGDRRRGSRHARRNRWRAASRGGVSRSRLLKLSPPVARCRRLMQPKPRLSSTTMISFRPEHHRGGDLRIHHQVGAVADHDDDLARRARAILTPRPPAIS